MEERLLLELVSRLEEVAPHVWELALRQVWIDAISGAILGIICAVVIWRGYNFAKKKADEEHEDDRWGVWLIFGLCATMVGLIGLNCFNCLIQAVLNPEWWAIKKLLP